MISYSTPAIGSNVHTAVSSFADSAAPATGRLPASEENEFRTVNRSAEQSGMLISHFVRNMSLLALLNDEARSGQRVDQA